MCGCVCFSVCQFQCVYLCARVNVCVQELKALPVYILVWYCYDHFFKNYYYAFMELKFESMTACVCVCEDLRSRTNLEIVFVGLQYRTEYSVEN